MTLKFSLTLNMIQLILCCVAVFAALYCVLIKPYKYWKERGIKSTKPWPIVGDSAGFVFRNSDFVTFSRSIYENFPGCRYSGFYQFFKPQLLIRDIELMKQITVKDFEYFTDRSGNIDEKLDAFFSKNLLSLKGKEWKDMRSILSPAFTGSKMRTMFPLIINCAEQFVSHFEKNISDETHDLEMKTTFTHYTSDVIATTAFGIQSSSLTNKDDDFYRMGKGLFDFSGTNAIKFMVATVLPGLLKLFNIKIFPVEFQNYFHGLIKQTIQIREENNIIRPDMIHLLMEARKGRLTHDNSPNEDAGFATVEESEVGKRQIHKELTDIDITAQAMLFFLAGFETSSTAMSVISYEIALNPDVQKKLQEEIDQVDEECGGKVNYDAILKMKYMDMVVSEGLRKWAPGALVERVCTKMYTIESINPGEPTVHVYPGQSVWFSAMGIHRDPQFYPNPDKFDPERFSDENKHKIAPYTYLPFGIGPRNCIGSRLALLEVKILFFYFLKSFDLVVTKKTPIPLVFDPAKLSMDAKGGYWLGLKKRVK